jgi:DNA-binding beta-propeller fold protein YncE
MRTRPPSPAILVFALAALASVPAGAGRPRPPGTHEAAGFQMYTSPQSNPIVACPDTGFVFAAATTSRRVDAINIAGAQPVWAGKADVGLEPVALAARPDGSGGCGGELWVANHVSDSISVVDIEPTSASFLKVVDTIQALDPTTRATRFDEPVGIAWAEDGSKAFVALSSRNQIAVVDATTHAVSFLAVNGQEPRALAVRNGRLFVASFESDNRTELSSCPTANPPATSPQCTVDIADIIQFAMSPNLVGLEVNIVVDPERPDRDLFVYRVSDGALLDSVEGVGTLLYGLAVAADGRVFVTQTDARNAVNGADDGFLEDLQNRMFDNQITRVDCSGADANPCTTVTRIPLDPALPAQPAPADALATPYGVALSQDGTVLLATAAASNRVFSLSTASNTVQGRADVGDIPRGVAFVSSGATGTGWVLNTLGNSVTKVTVGAGGALSAGDTVPIGADPTPEAVRRGRVAFESAFASDSSTFACASCHPDGNTDQLLWRIGGQCTNCEADEPRSTMPVRGLKDTVPLHWDGALGDPFGGANGAGTSGTDCVLGDADGDLDCFVDIVEESLAGVMCDQTGACPQGGTQLDSQARADMATFLGTISYPPARSRRPSDQLTASALQGMKDFFMDQGGALDGAGVSTCADSNSGCHELPLGTATNSQLVGRFDAPTMRGMTDRFIHFSNGITSTQEMVQGQSTLGWTPAQAMTELIAFDAAFPNLFQPGYGAGPFDIFQMFEEASTGHSGALGRQVTLSTVTTAGCPACPAETTLAELEAADARGVVNLRGSGLRNGFPVEVSFLQASSLYQVGAATRTRAQLVAEAQTGQTLVTLSALLRSGVNALSTQPLVAPLNANCGTGNGGTGDPALPSGTTFTVQAKYVAAGDAVFVDGARLPTATLTVLGTTTTCNETIATHRVQVALGTTPATGAHLLQIQNQAGLGLISNEMPFCIGTAAQCN